METKIYDYVIIGGGIAGLYAAYKIKQKNNNLSFIILEKNKNIGGRVGSKKFYNEDISIGAGIIRKNKDKLLLKLIHDLKIKTKEFNVNYNYSSKITNIIDVVKTINLLKKNYNGENETFKSFAKKILGDKNYKDFVISSGYSDYENSNIYDVLYNYGMEDNKCCYTAISVLWNNLIHKLAIKVGYSNIKTSTDIMKINKLKINSEVLFEIISKEGNIFISKKIIIATPIDSIKKLLPNYNIYEYIKGQHFIRIYGKFDKKSSTIMKEYVPITTIVPSILQKIIPINPDEGIYMISYSDNRNADLINKYSINTEENKKLICNIIEKSLGIPKNTLKLINIISFDWDIGTHYTIPFSNEKFNNNDFYKKVIFPEKNIFVVGEAVSQHQGWIEGALETVEIVV